MKGQKLNVRRKMKENEWKWIKKDALFIKKAFEDQFITFCQLSFGALWLFSLSLSPSSTLRFFLEHFFIGAKREKKEIGSKDQARKGRIKQLHQDSFQVSTFICIFLGRFGMHDIADCSFAIVAWIFSSCNSVFSLALELMDSHGMMGFSCFGWDGILDGFNAEWGRSPNDREHGVVIPELDYGSQ